jgi:hypothetical protein
MDRLPEELNATGQRIPFKDAQFLRPTATAEGYGTDPNVITPEANWPRILTPQQHRLINDLSDIILPATDSSPAPSTIGIGKFFDEWLSAPYPTQQKDKSTILAGLDLVDQESIRQFSRNFVRLSKKQKRSVIDVIIASGGDALKYFARFRYLVIGGYFTSEPGFKAIGYLGNTPLLRYAPVQKELERIIDQELQQLGL